ncbi:MAG: polymer-forming cytoskeletal protein [Ignavibacteria bacterium]
MLHKKTTNGKAEDISIISKGMAIEGLIKSNGNVRIDGAIKGNVTVLGNLTFGETAEVKGEVRAENITLSGKISGYVNSSSKLVLESKSVLKGDIMAKILVIEQGAFFEGTCTMSNEQKKDPVLQSESKK